MIKVSVVQALVYFSVTVPVLALEWPESCTPEQYHDPGLMACVTCAGNSSLVITPDGFSCACEDNSITISSAKCQRCSGTEVLSADGSSCVPKRCQKDASGRMACRKCPNDYIQVTQNLDGSATREVQCVKCSRGYKADNNRCIRCETCNCAKNFIAVRDKCVLKTFLVNRPKYEEKVLQPDALLDVVKHEYFCTTGDVRACRALANACVRQFYSTDRGGPCRFWMQSASLSRPAGLPQLLVDSSFNDGKFQFTSKTQNIWLVAVVHTPEGGMKILSGETSPCTLPTTMAIGKDIWKNCDMNFTELETLDAHGTFTPYIKLNGKLQPIPVLIRKPTGRIVQRGEWPSNKFGRYFLIDSSRSSSNNMTNSVYLRTLTVNIKIQRDKTTKLSIEIYLEAQYATKSPVSKSITLTLRLENQLPGAGVLRALEIWGGVLGALLALYAIVQWRGVLRRGGHQLSLVPIMSGCVADALYFAALFSTLQALAAQAGIGLTLPLSKAEEYIISAFIYAALSLKIVKVAWFNWKQCTCDVFFLDWSEYNPPLKESAADNANKWKVGMVAREWCSMQVTRRVNPGFTVSLALVILHFMSQLALPNSCAYSWVLTAIAWWCGYTLLLITRWLGDKVSGPPTAGLPRICISAGVSLLAFQEEFYAHYVHGRNDDASDARALAGPLSSCRVVCAPQLRMVFKQLSSGHGLISDVESRRALLSKFFAAFFERALDGMSWVASERSLLERLLDVEIVTRESSTSSLLYDSDDEQPSCFTLTWWCEEWSLATLDAMIFGCVLIAGGDQLLASLVTLIVWQISKRLRLSFGNRNVKTMTPIDLKL